MKASFPTLRVGKEAFTDLQPARHARPGKVMVWCVFGQLEQAGLVRRRNRQSDVRAVYARLTDDGMALLERAAPGHVALVRELLIDVLSPDQLRALADGLGEAGRRMQESDAADPR